MTDNKIIMEAGPTPGKVFSLTETEITVGRDIHAGIVINVPEVSRRHARLQMRSGEYILEDLGSTNGTFVNGKRLSAPYTLRSGDTIKLGEAIKLVFQGVGFDPDATISTPASHVETLVSTEPIAHSATMVAHDPVTPHPEPAFKQAPVSQNGAYSGQVPAGPTDFGEEYNLDEPKNRTWLWAGLGCLVILLCGCVAGAILFDMMDMYCQPPFDSWFSFLYSCQ